MVSKKTNEGKHSSSKPTKNKKIKSKNRTAMKIVLTMLVILMLSGIGALILKIKNNGGGTTGLLATVLGVNSAELENLEPIRILVMGISGVDDYKLADSIMIAQYNPKEQTASILSIPRDTYVGKRDRKTASTNYIASYKINTVFRSGTKIPEAVDCISNVTGLDLDNYIIIDTDALIKLVDAIGGVTFDVPIDMDYDDEGQELAIHLKAGEQLIDGAKAEQLLRFRHNNNGSTYPASYGMEDLGRMKTQRNFITATLKQVLKPSNIFKLKQIVDIMNEDVTTNMDLSKLKAYISYAVKFDADNIRTDMVPGTTELCNGVSIYVADKTKTKSVVNDLFFATENVEETTNTVKTK